MTDRGLELLAKFSLSVTELVALRDEFRISAAEVKRAKELQLIAESQTRKYMAEVLELTKKNNELMQQVLLTEPKHE